MRSELRKTVPRKTTTKKLLPVLLGFACLLGVEAAANATTLYMNNATGGEAYIIAMNPTTGAVTDEFNVPAGGHDNGRGVVVVSNLLYYTVASSPTVYRYDLATHTDLGAAFTVAGATALSTIAFDGTNFWIGDYSGTNHAYLYTPTGSLLSTISLSRCGGFCDGLEYFVQGGQGRLISNDGDELDPNTYDVYDTSGNLVTAGLIHTTGYAGTGIAFDGTDFYVDEIDNRKIGVYDTSGTLLNTLTVTGYNTSIGTPFGEDLSFDYSQVLPPPSGVPEPASVALMGIGLGIVGFALRRRRTAKAL